MFPVTGSGAAHSSRPISSPERCSTGFLIWNGAGAAGAPEVHRKTRHGFERKRIAKSLYDIVKRRR